MSARGRQVPERLIFMFGHESYLECTNTGSIPNVARLSYSGRDAFARLRVCACLDVGHFHSIGKLGVVALSRDIAGFWRHAARCRS